MRVVVVCHLIRSAVSTKKSLFASFRSALFCFFTTAAAVLSLVL